jgi:hypothetical protein
MQAELIRASRTSKKNTNQTEEPTTISTNAWIKKGNDQLQQVRCFSLKKSSKLHCNNSNNLYFSYEL